MHVDAEVAHAKQLLSARPLAALGQVADDVEVHGLAPVGSLTGRTAFADAVIAPLATALPNAHWKPQLFLGGRDSATGEIWTATHGFLRGAMTASLWRVPAVGAQAALRMGAFHRVAGGEVVEIRFLVDLVDLASQAGYELLPSFGGRAKLVPDPELDNGVVHEAADPEETASTLALVESMLGGCNKLVDGKLESMGMDGFWTSDMRWYGPHGLGATIGRDEFDEHAQGPSVASFPNRRGGFHQARFADGVTAAFTGWPSLQGTFDGVAFRGIEPTGGPIGQNIMDFYVRRGDRLHENWVLIDLVDFAAQCGVDLLGQLGRSGPMTEEAQ